MRADCHAGGTVPAVAGDAGLEHSWNRQLWSSAQQHLDHKHASVLGEQGPNSRTFVLSPEAKACNGFWCRGSDCWSRDTGKGHGSISPVPTVKELLPPEGVNGAGEPPRYRASERVVPSCGQTSVLQVVVWSPALVLFLCPAPSPSFVHRWFFFSQLLGLIRIHLFLLLFCFVSLCSLSLFSLSPCLSCSPGLLCPYSSLYFPLVAHGFLRFHPPSCPYSCCSALPLLPTSAAALCCFFLPLCQVPCPHLSLLTPLPSPCYTPMVASCRSSPPFVL